MASPRCDTCGHPYSDHANPDGLCFAPKCQCFKFTRAAERKPGPNASLYLAFLGTVTIPVHANTPMGARSFVVDSYAERGITLEGREVKVRLARKTDAGWLRDAGETALADELERAS